MASEKKESTTYVRLTGNDKEEFRRLAEAEGLAISDILRRAAKQYLAGGYERWADVERAKQAHAGATEAERKVLTALSDDAVLTGAILDLAATAHEGGPTRTMVLALAAVLAPRAKHPPRRAKGSTSVGEKG